MLTLYKSAVIAAVVPAFNEAKLISKVIDTMPAHVDFIVIVDDCSDDDTAEVVQGSLDPRVVLLQHRENLGVGASIVTGHRKALELGADVNVVMAGDAQMDPNYLDPLLDKVTVGGYGFSKANRFFSSDSFKGMPAYRVAGNIILSFLTKVASGYWHLFDPQNGYTAIRTEVLKRLPLDQLAQRYSFENDLLIQLNILQVPAVDVPVPAIYGEEVSSIKLRRVIPELSSLLIRGFWKRIWLRYVLWSFSPIALLLFGGLLFMIFGFALGIWMIAQIFQNGSATAATVMLVALPLLMGFQMLISALQLDIQGSPSQPDTNFQFSAPGRS